MNESVFREKSLEKVKSPDRLNEYIHVANPGVWILLTSVVVLLLGMCIWSVFGHLTTEIKVSAQSENGRVTCYIPESDAQSVRIGMTVHVEDIEGSISELSIRNGSESTCQIDMEETLPDGFYIATIEIENIHPASFLFH